jgi:hypothetical protein
MHIYTHVLREHSGIILLNSVQHRSKLDSSNNIFNLRIPALLQGFFSISFDLINFLSRFHLFEPYKKFNYLHKVWKSPWSDISTMNKLLQIMLKIARKFYRQGHRKPMALLCFLLLRLFLIYH